MAAHYGSPSCYHQSLPCHRSRYTTKLSPRLHGLAFTTRSRPPVEPWRCMTLRNLQTRSSSRESSMAMISGKPVVQSNPTVKLTYLEGNSWLWHVGGLNILVDPILVGNLDFGIPWLYDAAKKILKNFRGKENERNNLWSETLRTSGLRELFLSFFCLGQLEDLPELDCLLITQSLDDHCHVRTLKPLSEMRPDLRVISTLNAESILNPMFRNVTYLEPGESSELESRNGAKVNIHATAGPILGPPWQRPENGYIITHGESRAILYYEPHCVYSHSLLEKQRADIVITPVIKQLLPAFTLVSGQEDAVNLAKLLQAKFIVPMKNGDLDSKGILSELIKAEGTVESFKKLLSREVPDARVLEPTPGVPLAISLPESVS